MKKLNRRRRKHLPTRTVHLAVETLEPRVVLSASGFGSEDGHERFESRARDHSELDGFRSALFDAQRDSRGSERFGNANRHPVGSGDFALDVPESRHNRRHGGERSDHRRPEGFVVYNRHEPDTIATPLEPFADFGELEGDSTFSILEHEAPLFSGSFNGDTQAALNTQAAQPSVTLVLSTVRPATSSAIGRPATSSAIGSDLGKSSTALSPSTTPTVSSVNQPSSTTSTLPITLPTSSPSTNLSPPSTLRIDSSNTQFDAIRLSIASVEIQPASESEGVIQETSTIFVSLSINESGSLWSIDSEQAGVGSERLAGLSEVIRPATNVSNADSLTFAMTDRLAGLSEQSLWASLAEGGFVELDANATDNSEERSGFAEDSDDTAHSRPLPRQTPRDAYWFDFDDARFDSLFDSEDLQDLAEEQRGNDESNAEEETWLLNEGGMIVLTEAQFTDQVIDAPTEPASPRSPGDDALAEGIEIPMDANIGVFQAIDVATGPVDLLGEVRSTSDASVPSEDSTDAEGEISSTEQATTQSESSQSNSVRSAAMPWFFVFFTFFARSRNRRKRANERKREV